MIYKTVRIHLKNFSDRMNSAFSSRGWFVNRKQTSRDGGIVTKFTQHTQTIIERWMTSKYKWTMNLLLLLYAEPLNSLMK